MKIFFTAKVLRKRTLSLYKRHLRGLLSAVVKNRLLKLMKKYYKMRRGNLIKLFFATFAREIAQRPRIKLISRVIFALFILFFVSNYASSILKEKKAEIKVNGRSVLVADKSTDNSASKEAFELSSKIVAKRTPFEFEYPVERGIISQGFSMFHKAFDIATTLGSEIRPIGAGKVEFVGTVSDGKGNLVIVNHGEGIKSLYAHMSKIEVGVGDEVSQNSVLGLVGLTGRTTGPHVHLEIYDADVQIDPGDVLPDTATSFLGI